MDVIPAEWQKISELMSKLYMTLFLRLCLLITHICNLRIFYPLLLLENQAAMVFHSSILHWYVIKRLQPSYCFHLFALNCHAFPVSYPNHEFIHPFSYNTAPDLGAFNMSYDNSFSKTHIM